MNLILFVHQDGAENGAILKNYINQNLNEIQIQTLRTIDDFKVKLKQISFYGDSEIFILLADSIARLKELTSLVDLLANKSLILILPDNSKSTSSEAHQFFPNYFKSMSNTYDDLCDVLKKMMNQRNKQINYTKRRESIMEQLAEVTSQSDQKKTLESGKFLTFALATEEYGIGIRKVKEIIGMMPITSVPRTPEYVKGVINLRGKVIPVIELRLKFAMESITYSDRTCIIVVEIVTNSETVLIGIVVDAVSEVLNIRENQIEESPTFGTNLDTDYILGMAKMEGGVKILLDIDRVLSTEEIQTFEKTA